MYFNGGKNAYFVQKKTFTEPKRYAPPEICRSSVCFREKDTFWGYS